LSASSRRSATCRQRELLGDHDELVPAETPQRIGVADHAVQSRGDSSQELIASAVTEGVVDRLEVVEIDKQRRHRSLTAPRAREHLLDSIQDQRAVWEPGERVVGGQKRKLLIRALALGLKALAHSNEAELEAQLQDAQGLRERLWRDVQLRCALV
jgi:hypothetical protein